VRIQELEREPGRVQESVPLRGAGHSWSTLGGDTRSFAQVLRISPGRPMEDRGNFRPPWQFRGGRSGRGRGAFWREERFQMD
jgi:hypothetical protein